MTRAQLEHIIRAAAAVSDDHEIGEINDLVLSKWAAGREKDRDFARVAVQHRMVERSTLLERVQTMPLEPDHISRLQHSITAAAWAP